MPSAAPACAPFPNVAQEHVLEYEQVTATFCYEKAQEGEIEMHPYTITDCAYKLTYPNGPFPIPLGFENDPDCLKYALSWYRMLGWVISFLHGAP